MTHRFGSEDLECLDTTPDTSMPLTSRIKGRPATSAYTATQTLRLLFIIPKLRLACLTAYRVLSLSEALTCAKHTYDSGPMRGMKPKVRT